DVATDEPPVGGRRSARLVHPEVLGPHRRLEEEALRAAVGLLDDAEEGVELAVVVSHRPVQVHPRPRQTEPGPLECELRGIRRMVPQQHLVVEVPALGPHVQRHITHMTEPEPGVAGPQGPRQWYHWRW